jgi:hypothetical protein
LVRLICTEREGADRDPHDKTILEARLEGEKVTYSGFWGRWKSDDTAWVVAICKRHGWLRVPKADVAEALRRRKGRQRLTMQRSPRLPIVVART